MSGNQKLSGLAVLVACSPPMGAYQAAGGISPDDTEVWESCDTDLPGIMTQITDYADGGTTLAQIFNPVLSPDGTKILFEGLSFTTAFSEIWVVDNVPGSTATQLISDPSNTIQFPSWGPDSDTFLYVHGVGAATVGGTVYKDQVSAIGSPVSLKASAGGFTPYRPQFSFDGTRVSYWWDEDAGAGGDLRVMDADGTNDSSLDSTARYRVALSEGPQLSWANSQNTLVYDDGAGGSNAIYVINDDGTGQVQINANGDAAGAACLVSGLAWAPDDSYAIITANLGFGYRSIVRAELDGSTTTNLNASNGAVNTTRFRVALVYQSHIWFIEHTSASGGFGMVSRMALDGSNYTVSFNSTLGPGNYIEPFTGGDGWYFN